ncbi:hypothetical protein ASC92_20790 [Variovorax sp. Root411]|nr:hypothetical protein ASC92_20790 [Variovorax sp. Root411]
MATFARIADQAQALECDAGQIDGFYLDANPMNGRCMRNYQLDVADVHADGRRTGAFPGAILAKLDEPFASEILQLQLAQLRLKRIEGECLGSARSPQHFLHV